MYQDKVLTCRECGNEFTFTAGEQEFYAEKGFTNEPARCPACRQARKRQNRQRSGSSRQLFDAVCSRCGVETKVPFRPRQDKPVYCRECYQLIRR